MFWFLMSYLGGYLIAGIVLTYTRARPRFSELYVVPLLALVWPILLLGLLFRWGCLYVLDPVIEWLRSWNQIEK